ncbi:MAG: integrin alpha, partial [Planctomycetota bacterium]|nr:integrin alpha [Planctomycetota bacterium]
MKRLGISTFLLIFLILRWHSGLFGESVISLGDSDVKFFGAEKNDQATDASVAGDINGDGFSDLVLGAARADPEHGDSRGPAGRAYLVFGGPDLPGEVDLASLGARGIVILPGVVPGKLGTAVSDAGDFNGDGFDDFMVSAETAEYGGVVFVIFGGAPLPNPLVLSQLGAAGVTIIGRPESRFGSALANAGDFNGDGISDIVVGARKAGVPRRQKVTDTDHGHTKAGRAFIIFGGTDLPQRLYISELGNRGVVIDGIRPGDELGNSVDGAGDTNGDGFPDVVLGAERASPLGRSHAGQSYVVFGRADPPAMIDLRTLGAQGIVLHGARGGDRAGQDVAGAGDFDDDGVSDIIIGADRASPGDREHAGQAYVVFGSLEPLQEIDLKTLGSRGLVMNGVANGDKFGHSVHGIGDFNLDEVDDVIVGAERHDSRGRHKAGQVYIVFGGATPPTLLEISALGDGGIVLNAEAPGDMAGHTVADAGDVDGNSVPDVVITAKQASPLGREDAGTYYVFFGPPTPPPTDLICTRKLSENTLSWSNPTTFDAVRIDRNGVTIATLPGDATSFTDPDRIAGVLTYEVRGVRGGVPSLPVTCVLAVEVLAPFAFECVVEDGDAVLGWAHRHPVPVDGTRIFRDGMPLATVPEGQRTFRDPSPPAGPHTYAILDFLGSEESSLVECVVVVPVAPSALACAADGCDVSLSWTNNDAYSSVRVFRDGELVVVLSTGVLDAFVDRGVGVGQHAYEVQGCIGGDCSARAACGVTVLGAVVGLAGSSDGGDVTLSWTPPAAADAILVFRDMVLVADLPGIADSFVDPGVVSGTHEYEVRGRVDADLGKPSTVTVEVVDPVADLRGCANGRQIALSWRVTDVADFIEVFRDGALEAQLPGSAASLIDTVPGDGTFTYSVVAVRGNGRSSAAVTTEKVPVAPSAFEGTLANGNLDLTWVNSDAYDAIEITVNGVVQPRLPGTATSTRIAVGQLGSATVQVRGVVSAADCDNLSTPAEVTDVAVDAPFDLVCLADATDVSLQWSLGGVYDAIRVERDGVALGTVAGTATSFQDNLPGPGTFDYEVFGVINGVDTVPAACRVVVASPPASDCTIRDGRVLITWTTTEDHDSVVIERNGMAIGVLPAGVTEFVDPSPPGGVNLYGVRLRVLGSLGVPAECQVEILAPPSVVKCLADGDTVSIIWTNDAGFETIRVFRDGLEVTPVDGIAGTLRSFVDQPVPPGAFCYQIQGATAAGTLSSLSEPCCIQVLLPPVRLTCTVFDAEVTLDWLNPRVYQRINVLRDGMVVGRLAGNAMRFTDLDSPLSPGLYTYEVRGHVDSSNSFSKSSTASCLVSIANPVTDLNCTQVGDAILLKWVPSPDADAVLIQRNGQLISTESGNASRFLDDGLTPDVYSYEVRTGSGGDVGVAVECAVEMIRAPRDLACVQDGDMVTLT